ncbi:hypothetical protein J2T12_003948 [Paenibacillus anaericanus]|uniref:hypothetical protein n=1 Tax=Paenibacillus anaericanus TaxID=170367 RepID=UPI00278A60F1|nr:hypothetical protein [Paenibacillus anaericanus]MDQ0090525.1 hypothetical protein [Paenibacillus anaericanus]
MYKSLTLTSIYVNGLPSDAISTNEPNKQQVTALVRDVVKHLKLEGILSGATYKDLGQGSKAYEYQLDDLKILAIVKRLPIMQFEKDSSEYKYIDLEMY